MATHTEDDRLTKPLLHQLRIDTEQREDHTSSWRGNRVAMATVSILAVAAAFGGVYLSQRSDAFEIDTVAAMVQRADGSPAAISPTAILEATGYVTARRQATVSAQITGTITEVLIEEGDYVRAEQVLTRLESNAQKASLAQAQAQMSVAAAMLRQYEAQLAQARRDLNRSEDLLARQLVSAQAIEVARTQAEILQAQVESQHKQVELSRAAVQGAEVQLNYTTVRAPFSGVIVAKTAQAGEIVSPISAGGGFTRTGIGTIVDMDSLEIEIDVNEAYINRVKPGQSAQAVLDAYPGWTIPAHVIAVVPTADRSKATVKVRVAIDEHDPRILLDMGARVSFHEQAPSNDAQDVGLEDSEAAPKGVLVPSTAVVERDGKNVLFMVDGDHVRMQAIVPREIYSDLRLVEGVANGTIVVRDPPDSMSDGAPVLVKKQ